MLVGQLILLYLLRRQRVDPAGFALALDRDEIDFDQRRIVEAHSGLLANYQVDAIDFAEPLQA